MTHLHKDHFWAHGRKWLEFLAYGGPTGVQCTDDIVLLVVLMSQSNRVEFFLIFSTYNLLIGLQYVVLYFCYMNATHIILCGCT
jgi:preprotein translocase subunit Sec63